ncbi:hypothetical protein C5167_041274 [Papaver somniferum]|uniref:Uncharacterized protein n=1 Tax=Papaver somniferum TaxID=3469 RepID=A0A4Y7IKT6_PAPSO|nr:hypothetical protein C5167_041274 [Papaver somniferum]
MENHFATNEEADLLLGEYTEARIINKPEAPVMGTNYNYRVVGDDTFMSDQQSISVARRVTSTEPEIEAVLVEEKRIRTASSLKEARIVVDIKEPEKAREKLVDGGTSISKKHARTSLSEIEAILAKTQPCKLPLFTEPQQFYANQGFLGLQKPAIVANEAAPPVHHYYQRGGTAELMFDIVSQLPFNDQ